MDEYDGIEEDDLIGLSEDEEYDDYDLEYDDLNDLLSLGAVTIPKMATIKMPAFPKYTIPTMPQPPVAVATIEKHFKGLNTWYKDVTSKEFSFTFGSKTTKAKGLGNFFIQGANDISSWYKINKCGTLDIGCAINNVIKMYNGINHTRAFLAQASQLVSIYTAAGMNLNTQAGTDLLKNLTLLPSDIKKWFTDLQKNYTTALKGYNKTIQDEMLKTVNKVRDNINAAFKTAEADFKKLLDKASKDIQTKLKDFQTQITNAKTDFDKKVKDVKTQITNATNDFKSNLKIVNEEIEKAKKALEKITNDVTKIKEWSQAIESRIKSLEAKAGVPSALPPDTQEYYTTEELLALPQQLLSLPRQYLDKIL